MIFFFSRSLAPKGRSLVSWPASCNPPVLCRSGSGRMVGFTFFSTSNVFGQHRAVDLTYPVRLHNFTTGGGGGGKEQGPKLNSRWKSHLTTDKLNDTVATID